MSDHLQIPASFIRRRNLCVSGIRQFCADNGLEFREVMRKGIPKSEIERLCADERFYIIYAELKGERNG